MESNAIQTKIADGGLRRFVEEHSAGKRGVLIQLDIPAARITIGAPGASQWRRSGPCNIVAADDERATSWESIVQLKNWFEGIGLKVKYLSSAQVFVAQVTSAQLVEIAKSNKVRSIALNREVKGL